MSDSGLSWRYAQVNGIESMWPKKKKKEFSINFKFFPRDGLGGMQCISLKLAKVHPRTFNYIQEIWW